MEIDISQQARTLLLTLALGLSGGLVYDLLRAIRLRRKRSKTVTHVLDGIYVAVVAGVMLYLCVIRGGGELRLYMILGVFAGAVMWFTLPGPYCRELWDFWVDVAAELLQLLWKPAAFAIRGIKILALLVKKVFHFTEKYATMKKASPLRIAVFHRRKGGGSGGYQKERKDTPL